ncbi:hypothetical protein ON010_g14350 [Phytophthora cinnamomi]|nr:hypothetical protein ON010_g14350 [Phytophthora cinnamomi]
MLAFLEGIVENKEQLEAPLLSNVNRVLRIIHAEEPKETHLKQISRSFMGRWHNFTLESRPSLIRNSTKTGQPQSKQPVGTTTTNIVSANPDTLSTQSFDVDQARERPSAMIASTQSFDVDHEREPSIRVDIKAMPDEREVDIDATFIRAPPKSINFADGAVEVGDAVAPRSFRYKGEAAHHSPLPSPTSVRYSTLGAHYEPVDSQYHSKKAAEYDEHEDDEDIFATRPRRGSLPMRPDDVEVKKINGLVSAVGDIPMSSINLDYSQAPSTRRHTQATGEVPSETSTYLSRQSGTSGVPSERRYSLLDSWKPPSSTAPNSSLTSLTISRRGRRAAAIYSRHKSKGHRRDAGGYAASNDNSGDSSILRYIKTLTSHQTNAKQQRMDRYLRQVKHPQSTEQLAANGLKPAGSKHQDILKTLAATPSPAPQPQGKSASREHTKLLQIETTASSSRSGKGKAVGRRNEARPRAKRQNEGAPNRRQRKKVKEAPGRSQQSTSLGSLDRFRLNGTWRDKTQATATAKRGENSEPPIAAVQSAELRSHDTGQVLPVLGTESARFLPQRSGPQNSERLQLHGATPVNSAASNRPSKANQKASQKFLLRKFSSPATTLSAPAWTPSSFKPMASCGKDGSRQYRPASRTHRTISGGDLAFAQASDLAHEYPSSMSLCGENLAKETGTLNSLYYVFYESSSIRDDVPVMLWLSGGPGCSGLVALLFENGPCMFDDEADKLSFNPYSWTGLAHVIYLDQPEGTGYSDAEKGVTEPWSLGGAADRMREFLRQFYLQHPTLKTQDFYVFGESYAGHYVPDLASRLFDDDSSLPTLKGIAIGNGVVSTTAWVESTIPFLKSYNYGYHLIGSNEDDLQHASELFTSAIANCRREGNLRRSSPGGAGVGSAEAVQRFVEFASKAASSVLELGRNVYDIRRDCHKDDELHLCYRLTRLQDFVNTDATKAYFDEASHNWKVCSSGAAEKLAPLDRLEESEYNVARVLAHGVRVLVYGGDADTVVNWMSQDSWTRALAWEYQQAFTSADFDDVFFQGHAIGRVRTSHGLSFMKVYGAGHMVPHDQPAASYEIVRSFLYDAPGEGMFS